MLHACYLSYTDAHENRANTVSGVIKAPEGHIGGRGAKGAVLPPKNMTGAEVASNVRRERVANRDQTCCRQ